MADEVRNAPAPAVDDAGADSLQEQHEPTPSHEAEAEEHEAKLESDLEELTARAEKADEYLELAQRTKADFENYRKRAAREAAAAQGRGVAKLAKEIRPAVSH